MLAIELAVLHAVVIVLKLSGSCNKCKEFFDYSRTVITDNVPANVIPPRNFIGTSVPANVLPPRNRTSMSSLSKIRYEETRSSRSLSLDN